MTTYVYEPLDHSKAQTRLVTIPALRNLDESAPLQVSIHTVTIPRRYLETSLESALEEVNLNYEESGIRKPEFVALSYVWGSPDDPSEVFVDSAPEGANKVSITRNLDVALRHMRSKIEQPVVFWIDAICIDQGNLAERSYQVGFMDSIYTIAEGTSIWLGPEENNSSRAIDILCYLGERVSINANGRFERAPRAPPREPEEPIWESPDEESPYGEDDWLALVSFLERPWFTRVWVQQEIALADEAQLQCGTRLFDWDYFQVAVRCLLQKPLNPWVTNDLGRRIVKVRPNVLSICSVSLRGYRYDGLRYSLRGVRCTDPRDMIYGVRSLLTTWDKKLGIRPNYSLEAVDVFMDVCVRIVERESRTYFLKSCELSSILLPNLPSWVPDWSTSTKAYIYMDNPWSACGFVSANAKYLGRKILRVSGIQVDEITTIRDLYDRADDSLYPETRSVLLKYIWNCRPEQDRIDSPYRHKHWQSMMDAYCRTFTRDSFLETWYPEKRYGIEAPSFDQAKEALWKIWSMDEEMTEIYDLEDDPLIVSFIRYCRSCYECCFFTTKDGYVGLASPDAELGDIISVILGCDYPVILRKDCPSTTEPDETTWKVVGACYTHGLMSGEAIYGSLPSHYRAVSCAGSVDPICGLGRGLLDSRTDELKTDPAAVLEEFGIRPSSWTREPHRLEVSESVLQDAGVKLRDFLLV